MSYIYVTNLFSRAQSTMRRRRAKTCLKNVTANEIPVLGGGEGGTNEFWAIYPTFFKLATKSNVKPFVPWSSYLCRNITVNCTDFNFDTVYYQRPELVRILP
jgi:hypothetical protein